MRTSSVFLCLIVFLVHPVLADVYVPPWGEALYDSIYIHIQVEDEVTTVDLRTVMGVRKLVSDDYLLSFSRETAVGSISRDFEVEVSDSLCRCEVGEDGRLDFRYLSQTALEDTLRLSVHTRYLYFADEDGNALGELFFFQRIYRTTGDTVWWGIEEIPVYEQAAAVALITSNRQLSTWVWGGRDLWEHLRRGREIIIRSEMQEHYDGTTFLSSGYRIELAEVEGVRDTLTDHLIYELTPEIRLETPNLILDEDVSVNISHDGFYHLLADIRLEPELAEGLAPMWLWFPNDRTDNADVDLVGLFSYGYYGNFHEIWREDELEVRGGRVFGLSGFYIRVPHLCAQIVYPANWFWTDPHLRVEVTAENFAGDSARFILITAPLEYSRVRFIIPLFGEDFYRWESPFDHFRIEWVNGGRSLTFYGICRDPGVAQVWWADARCTPETDDTPGEFELTGVHPNPFNAETIITYHLPRGGRVGLTISDAGGRKMLAMTGKRPAGTNTEVIDASSWPTGVYVAQVETENGVKAVKLICFK